MSTMEAGRKAQEAALARIQYEFELDKIVVLRRQMVTPGLRPFYNFWVEPGELPVGEDLAGVTTKTLFEVSSATAHHLNGIGAADVYYKNGRVKPARKFE